MHEPGRVEPRDGAAEGREHGPDARGVRAVRVHEGPGRGIGVGDGDAAELLRAHGFINVQGLTDAVADRMRAPATALAFGEAAVEDEAAAKSAILRRVAAAGVRARVVQALDDCCGACALDGTEDDGLAWCAVEDGVAMVAALSSTERGEELTFAEVDARAVADHFAAAATHSSSDLFPAFAKIAQAAADAHAPPEPALAPTRAKKRPA